MKLSFTLQISVENFGSEFHENPTNNLAASSVTNVVFTYGVLFFFTSYRNPSMQAMWKITKHVTNKSNIVLPLIPSGKFEVTQQWIVKF